MLDTTGYLSSFGWQGKGNGLRQGSVSRPLSIPQKRTLSGLGRDRDEAFPFWDHLFAAASKSIKIKVSGDDEGDDGTSTSHPSLLRTTTGILSNRRPISGAPGSSGSVTPTDQTLPHLGLMATAKREGARKRLYACFLKGPVLGPDVDPHLETVSTSVISDTQTLAMTNVEGGSNDKKRKHEDEEPGEKAKKIKKLKSKRKDIGSDLTVVKERKKEKRRKSEVRTEAEDEKRKRIQSSEDPTETAEEKRQRKVTKLERRRRKDERRNAKEIEKMADSSRGNHD